MTMLPEVMVVGESVGGGGGGDTYIWAQVGIKLGTAHMPHSLTGFKRNQKAAKWSNGSKYSKLK